MGFSITISETIILIASVIMASAVSSYTIYMGNLVMNDVSQSVNEIRRSNYVKLKVAYATIESDCFVIYAKNVGGLPLSDYSSLDVYVGEYGKAQLYTYNETLPPGCFNLTIKGDDGDGVWDPGETARIDVNAPVGEIPTGAAVFEVKLVPLRGIGDSYLFPSPPS